MVQQNLNLPLADTGDLIAAQMWNELIRALDGTMNVSGDIIGGFRPGLFQLAIKKNSQLARDTATIGLIRADDTEGAEKLEAFKPAGVNEATFNTDLPNIGRRVMICEPAKPQHFANWVIPLRDIQPGFLGPAIINGLALVKYKTLFNKAVLNRVDIWGAETILTENIVGLGEFIHSEGKAIGVEQFAFIRMTARPDNVFRVSVAAGTTVGTPVYPSSGGLVGDGIPAMIEPDDDFGGHALIVVGKDITAENTSGYVCTGTCLAKVDAAGDPDGDFGAEDDETTLIEDNAGFKNIGSVGATGGSTFNIVRPFCPHLIRVDGVNSIDEQNATAVSEADGTMSLNLDSGDELAVAVHFIAGATKARGCYMTFTVSPKFVANWSGSDGFLAQQLKLRGQFIVEEFDPAGAHWNLITGLALRGLWEVDAILTTAAVITIPAGGAELTTELPLPTQEVTSFSVWFGRDGGFQLDDTDIDAGKKIHGVLLNLIASNTYATGTATATADPNTDKKTNHGALDIGGDF